jgi:hypothetical protein
MAIKSPLKDTWERSAQPFNIPLLMGGEKLAVRPRDK